MSGLLPDYQPVRPEMPVGCTFQGIEGSNVTNVCKKMTSLLTQSEVDKPILITLMISRQASELSV